MTAADIREHLEAEPFHAFRIHMSDGKSFDVTHPDMALLTRYKLIVGVGPTEGRLLDHIEHCSLLHIVRIEELQTA